MRLNTLAVAALVARTTSAFVPSTAPRTFVTSTSRTEMRATAPTMFIYWSIKTAMDTVEYALGKRDKVKGTGMLSFIEFEREPKNDDDSEEGE